MSMLTNTEYMNSRASAEMKTAGEKMMAETRKLGERFAGSNERIEDGAERRHQMRMDFLRKYYDNMTEFREKQYQRDTEYNELKKELAKKYRESDPKEAAARAESAEAKNEKAAEKAESKTPQNEEYKKFFKAQNVEGGRPTGRIEIKRPETLEEKLASQKAAYEKLLRSAEKYAGKTDAYSIKQYEWNKGLADIYKQGIDRMEKGLEPDNSTALLEYCFGDTPTNVFGNYSGKGAEVSQPAKTEEKDPFMEMFGKRIEKNAEDSAKSQIYSLRLQNERQTEMSKDTYKKAMDKLRDPNTKASEYSFWESRAKSAQRDVESYSRLAADNQKALDNFK